MNKRLYSSVVILAVLIGFILPVSGFGQKKKGAVTKVAQTPGDPLLSLPSSDGVVSVDVPRLLNEMLPRVFADDSTRLAKINERIDKLKTRTGIDVRLFDRVAVGARFITDSNTNSLSVESVALARGRFDATVMMGHGLVAADKGKIKYKRQQHHGATIYVFNSDDLFGKDDRSQVTLSEEARKAGGKPAEIADDLLQKILGFKGEVGILPLDRLTLAIGNPNMLRAAIDIVGEKNANVELAQLATRNPNAVVGFGVNMPANASRYAGLDNDKLATNLDAIRQVYGSVNSTATGFEMQNIARTTTDAQANEVYKLLDGFRDLGGFFAASLSGDKGKLAQTALDNLKIVKEGNEVQLRIELAQADVAMLVRVFDKRN